MESCCHKPVNDRLYTPRRIDDRDIDRFKRHVKHTYRYTRGIRELQIIADDSYAEIQSGDKNRQISGDNRGCQG